MKVIHNRLPTILLPAEHFVKRRVVGTMPPKKEIPKERLIDLINKGYKLKHIAEALNCDISTVKARLNKYDIPYEVKFADKIEIPKEEIIKKIREGKTYKQIAKELGVSYQTLLNRAKEHKIDYWEVRIPRDELKRLVKRGMNVAEIANWFKVSQRTIEDRMKKYGIKRKKKKHDPTPRKISRKLLYKWYVEDGMSVGQIANELGMPDSTVYNYLKKYEIPLRSREVKPDPTKEEIVQLYYGENLTFHETAKKLGIGSGRLASLMRQYNIQPKPKSQKKYSDEEILEELRRAIQRYGRLPLQKELRYDDEFRIDVKTVVRRFGSWKDAMKKASLPEKTA